MTLRVYCSPHQRRLERMLIEKINESRAGLSRRLVIVTPSRVGADSLQRRLSLENGLSVLNVRFHTMVSLSLELTETFRRPDEVIIGDPLFHDQVIDRLIPDRRRGSSSHPRGLAAAYRMSVRELEDAGVQPDTVLERLEDLSLDEEDRDRLASLLRIQKRYGAELRRLSVRSVTDILRLAVRAIESKSFKNRPQDSYYFYGFHDMTGLQIDLFQALSARCPVVSFLSYRKDHPAFQYVKPFYELHMHRSGSRPVHLQDDGATDSDSIGDRLFDTGSLEGTVPEGRFRVISVSGQRDAIWKAAKEILRLHERPADPIPFHEIGVVARSIAPYRSMLADLFDENDIPYSWDCGEPLPEHPVVKKALLLLSFRRRDFPAPVFQDIVSSPYFTMGNRRGPSVDRGERWGRIIALAGIHSGLAQWKGKLEALSSAASSDHRLTRKNRKIRPADIRGLWEYLSELSDRLGDPDEVVPFEEAQRSVSRLLKDTFTLPAGDRGTAAWKMFLSVLDELTIYRRILPRLSRKEFCRIVEEKVWATVLPPRVPHRGVRVCSAGDVAGETFRAVLVIGLNEGVFPRASQEDPLLPDRIRLTLQSAAGYWIRPRMAGYDAEKLLFHHAVSSGTDRLVCLFSRSDEEGKAQVPSIYLRELCRTMGFSLEESVERVPRQMFSKLESEGLDRLTPKEVSVLSAGRGLKIPLQESSLWRSPLQRLGRGGEPSGYDGLIHPPEAFRRDLERKGLSPSAVDVFSQCPFEFFARRLWNLEEPEESTDRGEMSARARGEIYHEILRRFYESVRSQPRDEGFVTRRWEKYFRDAVGKVFSLRPWESLGLYPLLWESHRRKMTRSLRFFLREDLREQASSGMRPSYFEHELRGDARGLRLRGRLDRIDFSGDGDRYRIIDYKSRRPVSRKDLTQQVLGLEQTQPGLYLEMGDQTWGHGSHPLRSEGVLFCYIERSMSTEKKGSRDVFSVDSWRLVRGDFLSSIGLFKQQMERGDFIIVPREGMGENCGYCPYSRLCRKAHQPTRRRAEMSAIRKRFDDAHRVSEREGIDE
ncbi:MAG TPA: PD-(D/E)XK nuclease family protein [Elusimicrobiota bacterium]|nr:PD-(D/E)XK nuclease family protein [Elusimicrobiota bacterium]